MDSQKIRYPEGLLDWAGHRAGGVRRLFYAASGRPAKDVIRTRLLDRLSTWTKQLVADMENAPRAVFLVGGPGNGKTEAIEYTITEMDVALNLGGRLNNALSEQFLVKGDLPTPRLAQAQLGELTGGKFKFTLSIVQDASSSDLNKPLMQPAALLVEDLEGLLSDGADAIYLACINRGVLDDALIFASENGRDNAKKLIEMIVQSIGIEPDAPACWPLLGFPSVAVWPMDVETLVGDGDDTGASKSPFLQLLDIATDAAMWPDQGTCLAGDKCPFCGSRAKLMTEPYRSSLQKILRWYELSSGKRWSFRDLFSLLSFIYSGVAPDDDGGVAYKPCDWAARLLDLSARPHGKPDSLRTSALFRLVAAQYEHALFGRWPVKGIRSLRRDISELKLEGNATLMGFYHFFAYTRGQSIPPTLQSQLVELPAILDPALADPNMKVEVSSRTTISYRDIDTRFSQSVGEGLRFIQKYKCLSPLEVDLLKKLDIVDQQLSDPEVVKRRPAVANRVQALLREFACRLVRRSIGTRAAAVRDADILADYQKVAGGDVQLLHSAVKQVEALLNQKDRFVVNLNTTFGEPLPPIARRAVLTTMKQIVKLRDRRDENRPDVAIRFLSVEVADKVQSIPLGYELFKSVRELRSGMMTASLPRAVVALLDTTKARLAGLIVRNEDLLEGGEIKIGLRNDVIVRQLGEFLVQPREYP